MFGFVVAWPDTEVNNDPSCCGDHRSQPENQCCDRISPREAGVSGGRQSSRQYGVVNLHGLSLRRRAEALISIAHPDVRDELRRETNALRH
jgi:hypothetical protein